LFHKLRSQPKDIETFLGDLIMRILHIDSSILGANSASRVLTAEITAQVKAAHPEAQVQHLDLAADALPHLTGGSLAQADQTEAARNAQAMNDFLAADVIVVGAPMYNFAIPTQLKAWIDRVVVAGKTFRYTQSGPEGLVKGKRVIVGVSRGSVYGPDAAGEFAESYLKHVFRFIGIEDVKFVRAEGLGLSAEHREKSLSTAVATIRAPMAAAA
jgi:FMN-dependent NADH-azoreductase